MFRIGTIDVKSLAMGNVLLKRQLDEWWDGVVGWLEEDKLIISITMKACGCGWICRTLRCVAFFA